MQSGGKHRFIGPLIPEMDIQIPQFVGEVSHKRKILSESIGDLHRKYVFHLTQSGAGTTDGYPEIVENFRIPVLRKVGFVDPDHLKQTA